MKFQFFPALFKKPTHINFAEQEKDETIEVFLRAHWITNVPWIVSTILAFFLPFFVVFVLSQTNAQIAQVVPIQVFTGLIIIWYLLTMAFALESFLFWYFNIYIVTNIHVLDINFRSMLSRDITEVELNDIQSVSSDIKGVVRSLFHYGTVVAKTAAQHHDIEFVNVPQPDFVADTIQDLREKYIHPGSHPA